MIDCIRGLTPLSFGGLVPWTSPQLQGHLSFPTLTAHCSCWFERHQPKGISLNSPRLANVGTNLTLELLLRTALDGTGESALGVRVVSVAVPALLVAEVRDVVDVVVHLDVHETETFLRCVVLFCWWDNYILWGPTMYNFPWIVHAYRSMVV